jgi:hypothetical protein
MDKLKLYERYDRYQAIAHFGSETDARSLCDGQWLIFPDVVLCFADVGEPPTASHFRRGGEFCWVADKPYRVSDDKDVKFVPREVVGRQAKRREIHLFVRSRGSDRYLYVGKLGPSYVQIHGVGKPHGAARFRLSPALPSEVWMGLGGLHPGDLDHAAVDAALDRLRNPVNVEERLWVLQQLVDYWHGPIGPEDGIPEAELDGLAMPYPLRWWYGWAGRRKKIMSGQNGLLDPDMLNVRDGLLEFYAENQYCYQWGTHLEGDDPPVFGRSETINPWKPEGITLSEHLILACLFEAVIAHSPYGASTVWLEDSVIDRIAEHVPPIPIGPWRWGGSTRFYARGGAFMVTMSGGEIGGRPGGSVWIGAKTEHPLQFLTPFIGKDWDHVAV